MGHSFGRSMSLALTESHAGQEPDPRIKVAIPMTPSTTILPLFGFGVTRSRVPTLFFGAMRDATLDYETEQLAGYQRLPTPKILAAVHEAGHFSYTDLCRPELEGLATALGAEVGDILSDGCGPDFIDATRMRDIQRWLVTSFLHAELRGSDPARDALAPAALPAELAAELDYRVELTPLTR
jgi:predicted dienelactone hydrolase